MNETKIITPSLMEYPRNHHPHSLENLRDFSTARSVRVAIPIGTRFGKLVVKSSFMQNGRRCYVVDCDCGKTRNVIGCYLKNGRTKACNINNCRWSWIKHGFKTKGSNCPEYYIWKCMRQRCSNPRIHNYHNYGGRGISVCARWSDFAAFFEDMGKRPGPEYSIGRIDNDGNYEPDNCRWETHKQQARNTSTNRFLILNGVSKTVAEWAERLGVRKDFLHCRLTRGWSDERTLTEPAHNRGVNAQS